MRIKYLAIALAVTIGLLFTVSTADAKKPAKVDCDVLAAAISDADTLLDAAGVVFNSLGDLVATALLDDAQFAALNDILEGVSGGAISFDSASQAVSTIGKCGLTPLLIAEIMD